MSAPKITLDQLKQEILQGLSLVAIAKKYDINIRGIQRKKAELIKQGWSPDHKWDNQVPEGYMIKGMSDYVDGEGNVLRRWVKSEVDKEVQKSLFIESITAFVDELPKVIPQTIYNEHEINTNLLTVYPLGDPHIGMMAWEKETGENWDLKIAEDTFINMFDRVIKCAPKSTECLILNLGDFFHYDNMEGFTSRSHNVLDRDGRYAKMVQVGVKIMRRMITTALQHHERVRVINCIGNHDDTGSIFLSVCLKHVYETEPRIIIDDSPAPFHYVRFGKVLIGAHHGHTCKMDKLPGVMAADRYKDWGETQFRYWLTGHIHKDSKIADEHAGCMVESFRTLAAKDAYATYGGWRSGRDTKVIVYHKQFGEVERHTINLAQMQPTDK